MVSIPRRRSFNSDCDVNQLRLRTRDCRGLAAEDIAFLATAISTYGFALLNHDTEGADRDQLRCVSAIFGSIVPHVRSDADGIAAITPTRGFPGYYGTSSEPHPPHTDGAFDERPPGVTILQCIRRASAGGETQLVSGRALHESLAANEESGLQELFAHDALTVHRDQQISCSAVFAIRDDRVRMRLRLDETAHFADRPRLQRAVQHCRTFVSERANVLQFTLQPQELLIIDNWGIMHGRTAFPQESNRLLLRANVDGSCCDQIGARLGFDI